MDCQQECGDDILTFSLCNFLTNEELADKEMIGKSVQCGPQLAIHEVLTNEISRECCGINHTEGAWPKDLSPSDPEQTMRYKKKIEKDDAYISSINHLSDTMEYCILQNNAIDLYESYFEDEDIIQIVETYSAKIANVYKNPQMCPKRPIQNVSWSLDGGQIAASYCSVSSPNKYKKSDDFSYIWNIECSNYPEYSLDAGDAISYIMFNPKDCHNLLCGLHNGKISFLDLRKGLEPVETTPMNTSHTAPIRGTIWTNCKSGTEFFSSSLDGQVKWWDIRKMVEPLENLKVEIKGESQHMSHGVSVLEYEHLLPTRFMVGTDTGYTISGNRKERSPSEKWIFSYKAQDGPVRSLQRNPSFLKNFLTVGDWCTKIWSEDCRESPILRINNSEFPTTYGVWSPARHSVFFTAKMDGNLDVWDLVNFHKQPSLTVKVCDEELTCLKCHEGGQLLVAADSKGTLHLMKLSENLSLNSRSDKTTLTSIFEREIRREKIVESKMKELRLKSKVGRVIDTRKATKDSKNEALNAEKTCMKAAENDFLFIIKGV